MEKVIARKTIQLPVHPSTRVKGMNKKIFHSNAMARVIKSCLRQTPPTPMTKKILRPTRSLRGANTIEANIKGTPWAMKMYTFQFETSFCTLCSSI